MKTKPPYVGSYRVWNDLSGWLFMAESLRHYAPLGLNHIKPRRGYKHHAPTERLPNRVRRHQVAVFLGPLAAW